MYVRVEAKPEFIDTVIDADHAVRYNRSYAQKLGWLSYYGRIGRLLGFIATPGERSFAKAVARWQKQQGLPPTGILEPVTWSRMRIVLGVMDSSRALPPDQPGIGHEIGQAKNPLRKCPQFLLYLEKLPDQMCEGSLGKTKVEREVKYYFFPGRSNERALVIAGVHGSELSGIEVATILKDSLRTGPKPFFNTIVVPELFRDNAARARKAKLRPGDDYTKVGRYTNPRCDKSEFRKKDKKKSDKEKICVDPNRQFPAAGKPFYPDKPNDALGRPIEPENKMLLELIDLFKPSRIASIHAHTMPSPMKRGKAGPGIFADPHRVPKGVTQLQRLRAALRKARRTGRDCKLALAMASRFRSVYNRLTKRKDGAKRIPGNWLDSKKQTCWYGRASIPGGVSLGKWGPAPIPGVRDSITVITVEVRHYYPSNAATPKKLQARRRKELQAHAEALRKVFLERSLSLKARKSSLQFRGFSRQLKEAKLA